MKISGKSLLIFGSGLGLGACAIIFYRYWKRREAKSIDEGFEDVSKIEDNPEKRILVVGLSGAGKSTLISQLINLTNASIEYKPEKIRPTEGFNVSSIPYGNKVINFWEIGGGENVRRHWNTFLQDTDILVFVVDAAAPDLFLIAGQQLKNLLGDDRLDHVPIVILANKQDLPEAMKPMKIGLALDIASISLSKHQVCLHGTQTRPSKSDISSGTNKIYIDQSIKNLKKTLLSLL